MRATTILVKVSPRASRNGVEGQLEDGTYKIKLTSSPVDGKANESMIFLLAEILGMPKKSIRIVRGLTSRSKVIEVEGIDPEVLSVKLHAACRH